MRKDKDESNFLNTKSKRPLYQSSISGVPLIYDKMTPFKDGKSWVTLNGESFYIDEFGKRL